MRTLINILPLHDFCLECLFSDGTIKIADIKPFLKSEVFSQPLKSHFWFKVKIFFGSSKFWMI